MKNKKIKGIHLSQYLKISRFVNKLILSYKIRNIKLIERAFKKYGTGIKLNQILKSQQR